MGYRYAWVRWSGIRLTGWPGSRLPRIGDHHQATGCRGRGAETHRILSGQNLPAGHDNKALRAWRFSFCIIKYLPRRQIYTAGLTDVEFNEIYALRVTPNLILCAMIYF